MMKKIAIILTMLIFNSCYSQSKVIMRKRVIDVVLKNVGKTTIDKIATSHLTGIKEDNYTTSLYYYDKQNKIVGFPINDEIFNYEYFNSKIYNNLENKRVKLFLDVYKNKSKEICIIYKIE